MRGKNRGVRFDEARRFSDSKANELHAVISNPRVLVSPWEIAPKPLPNMAPLTAPVLMDSMILGEP